MLSKKITEPIFFYIMDHKDEFRGKLVKKIKKKETYRIN